MDVPIAPAHSRQTQTCQGFPVNLLRQNRWAPSAGQDSLSRYWDREWLARHSTSFSSLCVTHTPILQTDHITYLEWEKGAGTSNFTICYSNQILYIRTRETKQKWQSLFGECTVATRVWGSRSDADLHTGRKGQIWKAKVVRPQNSLILEKRLYRNIALTDMEEDHRVFRLLFLFQYYHERNKSTA